MIAKMTSKNQLTLPKAIVQAIGNIEYFDVSAESGRIVLTPVTMQATADSVRAKLEQLGIVQEDVAAAVAWARNKP